jgi:hypothetical protein
VLKLYRVEGTERDYWETWDDSPKSHIVHWGKLGERGSSKVVTSTFFKNARHLIQKEIDGLLARGFKPVAPEDHATLMIEYTVEGMGCEADLKKRHALEARMNELLGWTGLGLCDGGSIGSGTMEVCSLVVDFDTAKRVIEDDLASTPFSDFTRIYEEGRD